MEGDDVDAVPEAPESFYVRSRPHRVRCNGKNYLRLNSPSFNRVTRMNSSHTFSRVFL